jgi:tRNA (cmo5U34)-methyltransferase
VTAWSEGDSSTFREIAEVAVPCREEMTRALIAAVPFAAGDAIRVVDLGCGEGELARQLLDAYPRATLIAFDGSESMRGRAEARLARFGDRARVRAFDVASLDWWDQMLGADLVVSSLCLHHLNDAKKQYLYKAVSERISPRGALLFADLVEPMHSSARRVAAGEWDARAKSQAEALGRPELFTRFLEARWNHFRFPDSADRPSALFHHLVWLRHAGFAAVDCVWLHAGHAVIGGFKQDAASGRPLPADS